MWNRSPNFVPFELGGQNPFLNGTKMAQSSSSINLGKPVFSFHAWSGREDSNLRPPGPKPGALPDCATPRYYSGSGFLPFSKDTVKHKNGTKRFCSMALRGSIPITHPFVKTLAKIESNHNLCASFHCCLSNFFHDLLYRAYDHKTAN